MVHRMNDRIHCQNLLVGQRELELGRLRQTGLPCPSRVGTLEKSIRGFAENPTGNFIKPAPWHHGFMPPRWTWRQLLLPSVQLALRLLWFQSQGIMASVA